MLGGAAEGRGDGCAHARSLLRFFCSVSAWQKFQRAQEGRESPRARAAPEPVQTGRGEVWFGLVWIPTPLDHATC